MRTRLFLAKAALALTSKIATRNPVACPSILGRWGAGTDTPTPPPRPSARPACHGFRKNHRSRIPMRALLFLAAGALAATLTELHEPFGLNDNLTIPIFSSLAMQWAFSRIQGWGPTPAGCSALAWTLPPPFPPSISYTPLPPLPQI